MDTKNEYESIRQQSLDIARSIIEPGWVFTYGAASDKVKSQREILTITITNMVLRYYNQGVNDGRNGNGFIETAKEE